MENLNSGISVGKMIELLKYENPELPLYFGGLSFYRLKDRGSCIQVEFDQIVSQDSAGLVVVENR